MSEEKKDSGLVACSIPWDPETKTYPLSNLHALQLDSSNVSPFSLESQHEWIFQARDYNHPNPFTPLVFLALKSIIVPSRKREIALPYAINPERVGITHAHELDSCLLYEDIWEERFYLFDWTASTWEKLRRAPFTSWFHVVEAGPGLLTFATRSELYSYDRDLAIWTRLDTAPGVIRDICGLEGRAGGLESRVGDLYVMQRAGEQFDVLHVWSDGSVLKINNLDLPTRHSKFDNRCAFGSSDKLFENLALVSADPGWRQLSVEPLLQVPVPEDLGFNKLECGVWPAVGLSGIGVHVAGKTIKLPEMIHAYNYNPKRVCASARSVFFLVDRTRLHRYDLAADTWEELPPEPRFLTSDFASILETETGDVFLGHLGHVKILRKGDKQWRYLPDLPRDNFWHVVSLFRFSARLFAVCTAASNARGTWSVLVSLPLSPVGPWVHHCEVDVPVAEATKPSLVCVPTVAY